jgi:hypothetical protein
MNTSVDKVPLSTYYEGIGGFYHFKLPFFFKRPLKIIPIKQYATRLNSPSGPIQIIALAIVSTWACLAMFRLFYSPFHPPISSPNQRPLFACPLSHGRFGSK